MIIKVIFLIKSKVVFYEQMTTHCIRLKNKKLITPFPRFQYIEKPKRLFMAPIHCNQLNFLLHN